MYCIIMHVTSVDHTSHGFACSKYKIYSIYFLSSNISDTFRLSASYNLFLVGNFRMFCRLPRYIDEGTVYVITSWTTRIQQCRPHLLCRYNDIKLTSFIHSNTIRIIITAAIENPENNQKKIKNSTIYK